MKTAPLLLSAALGLTLCAAGWLFMENRQLRDELTSTPVFPHHQRKVPVLSVPTSDSGGGPAAGPGATRDGKPAANGHFTGRRDSLVPPPKNIAQSLQVADNGDGTFTVSDPGTGWQRVMTSEEMRDTGMAMQGAMTDSLSKRPGGPSWSPGQVAGAPDTANHGDYSTAWASQSQDGGKEWLNVKYAEAVEIREINIHETYNPGAISKVSAMMPDGSERVIWEGTMNPEEGIIERAVPVPPGIRSDQIRVELDTSRVPGWNEIDAVELVGRDGSRQWATEGTASSYFGQNSGQAIQFSDTLLLTEELSEATSLTRDLTRVPAPSR
ncbi:MAG: hypothetical protein ACKV19_14460 [Verrucomicrobiales bacterium]